MTTQACRDCGKHFPYDEDADRCPECVAESMGEVVALSHRCGECGLILKSSLPSALAVDVFQHEQYHAKRRGK